MLLRRVVHNCAADGRRRLRILHLPLPDQQTRDVGSVCVDEAHLDGGGRCAQHQLAQKDGVARAILVADQGSKRMAHQRAAAAAPELGTSRLTSITAQLVQDHITDGSGVKQISIVLAGKLECGMACLQRLILQFGSIWCACNSCTRFCNSSVQSGEVKRLIRQHGIRLPA
ncbi:MAG: hypothetical protein R2854_08565 [Caldilineaceae bacterium]